MKILVFFLQFKHQRWLRSDTVIQPLPDDNQALSLRTEFGSEDTLLVEVEDIFAIWWDPAFDHSQDLEVMFGWLKEIRQD